MGGWIFMSVVMAGGHFPEMYFRNTIYKLDIKVGDEVRLFME